MSGYVGDGETLPTNAEEALDLLNGVAETYTSGFTDRPDVEAALTILDRFIKDYATETDCKVCGDPLDVHGWHDDLTHRYE